MCGKKLRGDWENVVVLKSVWWCCCQVEATGEVEGAQWCLDEKFDVSWEGAAM